MESKPDLKALQTRILSEILSSSEYEELYNLLSEKEPGFGRITRDAFNTEYLAAKLALASRFWEKSCSESMPESGEQEQKLFFKAVMKCFQSPKMVPLATAFSEYLLEPSGEEGHSPVIQAGLKLFGRFGLAEKITKGSGPKAAVSDAFRILVETLEGFRVSFENDFMSYPGFDSVD